MILTKEQVEKIRSGMCRSPTVIEQDLIDTIDALLRCKRELTGEKTELTCTGQVRKTSDKSYERRTTMSVKWEMIEDEVVKKIRALKIIDEQILKQSEDNVSNKWAVKIHRELIVPAATLLAEFCACVDINEDDAPHT